MKRYPKTIQCDDRGQLVIPKDIRSELGIGEGTGFWMHSITNEGILLKKIEAPALEEETMIAEIDEKAEKIGIKKEHLKKTLKEYKKTQEGNLELI
jgi:AbrB family looped-hinge helix DNA binding protein